MCQYACLPYSLLIFFFCFEKGLYYTAGPEFLGFKWLLCLKPSEWTGPPGQGYRHSHKVYSSLLKRNTIGAGQIDQVST